MLLVVGILGYSAFDVWHKNKYKQLLQVLNVPSRNIQFVLMTDSSGFNDRAWYVYKQPLGDNLTKSMKAGHDKSGALFWNYSETGDHCENPGIAIINNRYFVFSRGGLYHSLYDIKEDKVLVNDESPWASYLSSDQFKKHGNNSPPESNGSAIDIWVEENINSKIKKIINTAT